MGGEAAESVQLYEAALPEADRLAVRARSGPTRSTSLPPTRSCTAPTRPGSERAAHLSVGLRRAGNGVSRRPRTTWRSAISTGRRRSRARARSGTAARRCSSTSARRGSARWRSSSRRQRGHAGAGHRGAADVGPSSCRSSRARWPSCARRSRRWSIPTPTCECTCARSVRVGLGRRGARDLFPNAVDVVARRSAGGRSSDEIETRVGRSPRELFDAYLASDERRRRRAHRAVRRAVRRGDRHETGATRVRGVHRLPGADVGRLRRRRLVRADRVRPVAARRRCSTRWCSRSTARSPGSPISAQVAPIIAQGMAEARVRLDFTVGGRRVHRHAGRAPDQARRRQHCRGSARSRAAKCCRQRRRGATARSASCSGLSYEHFTKCVVLPQGEFARFLHDKPRDRQDLLVSTARPRRLRPHGGAGRAASSDAKAEAAVLEGRLGDLASATPDAIAAAAARVKRLVASRRRARCGRTGARRARPRRRRGARVAERLTTEAAAARSESSSPTGSTSCTTD